MCQLPFDKHVNAVARFINDKGGYEGDAPRYHVKTIGLSWRGIIDNTTDAPIFGGESMDEFNTSYGAWWDEHYPGDVPF